MKKFYIILIPFLLIALQIKAQSPNSISYQGVARNISGLVLPNQGIGLRFTIHQGSVGGTVVYQETQSATTNLLGLFTVAIGSGTVVSGTFATIGWSTSSEFLQVEMDPTAFGGTSYLDMGTNKFLSVPYALSAGSTSSGWNLTGNSSTGGTDYIGTTDANDLIFKTAGSENARIANATGNVGISTPTPVNKLDVNGSAAVGSYAGTNAAPANGLIVSGQVGIGTNTPNAGAVLDVNSSTQGMLIPRLASNPASPAQAMMYYNTTTGCFMFYSGTAWQAIICGCPNNPAAPGSITGTSNFCPSATGVVYSISPVSNATGYTWSVPAGAAITAGQGSTSIAITEGTVAGSISVAATNNCGTGTASTLALTPVASIITGQPANATVTCAGSNPNFTVTATGSPSYQWQVSTNGGGSFSNVTNGGVYSGATTSSLTVTGPTSGMNGNQYRAIVTGTCAFTSNAATLTVSSLQSLPITITNSQGTATASGLQVKISPLSFTNFSNLSNIEFTTGAAGTGTPLYAWIESAAAPTASATELTTAPTTATTTAVVWVNLGTTIIPANGSITIYLTQLSSAVMTGTTGFTGMAPQLTSPYGQLDNGALVFPTLYDNFAGTTLNASKWTLAPSCAVTLNNAITSMTCPGHWYGIYNTSIAELNTVAEVYWKSASVATVGPCILTNGVEYQFGGGGGNGEIGFGTGGTLTTSSGANQNFSAANSILNADWYVFTAVITNSTFPIVQVNYGVTSVTATSGATETNGTGGSQGIGIGISNTTGVTAQWFRDRVYPPGGALPAAAVGAFGCY